MVEVLWTRRLHLRSSAMAVSPGTVVVAERHSRLVRLDSATGAPRWDQHVEDCWGTPVIAGDRCLYLSQAGVLHCFDFATGHQLWSRAGLQHRRYVTVSGSAIFTGGWRGYHPLMRLALADGSRLPMDEVAAGPLAMWGSGGPTLLIAAAGRPVLSMMAESGALLAEWPLPEPALETFRLGTDGRVVFLSGTRTVMSFRPDRGVQVLWRHARDIRPLPPILDGQTLWLVDAASIVTVDVERGAAERHLPSSAVFAATLAVNRVLFALRDGSIAGVDGEAIRVLPQVDRLFTGEGGLVHAIGKGNLVTFRPCPVQA